MTLLIWTPTHENGPDLRSVESVSLQQTEVKFEHKVNWLTDPLPGRNFSNVVRQYQQGWQVALDGGYEALLTVEHDMLLPKDAIEKLWNTDAGVVYGTYLLRHGTHVLNTWQYINNQSLGMSLSLYPDELRRYKQRGWAEVCGVGWGCTLIRREVLQRLTVKANVNDAGDIAFATDCVRAGIRQIARFDVPCGHIDQDGMVLEPFKNGGIVARVYALQNVTANVEGHSVQMTKDHYYTVPLHVGKELARAGYVKLTNEDREEPQVEQREMAVDPKAAARGTRKPVGRPKK